MFGNEKLANSREEHKAKILHLNLIFPVQQVISNIRKC